MHHLIVIALLQRHHLSQVMIAVIQHHQIQQVVQALQILAVTVQTLQIHQIQLIQVAIAQIQYTVNLSLQVVLKNYGKASFYLNQVVTQMQ